MPTTEGDGVAETHNLFPSGEWEGFYTYHDGPDAARHMMSFVLHFQNNIVTGHGSDDIASFIWRGHYNKENLRCQMTKHYDTHTVFYDGNVDENGIWGMWTIGGYLRGGFHIWPKKDSAGEVEEAVVAEVKENLSVKKVSITAN